MQRVILLLEKLQMKKQYLQWSDAYGKALEKAKEFRYKTVQDFVDDVSVHCVERLI